MTCLLKFIAIFCGFSHIPRNLETFLFVVQVSLMVAKDAELHKSTLQFFMEQFYGIIRRMDSSNKELSIAIRGYGLFAAVCAGNVLW